ncbi:Rust resistance kinase Lr10 [Glycine soja]|uniref:Rust resistance kinase Lr10 n=2 Tax=Glycine soja TaxID=3848 RepID=A0A445J2Q5_GLYSO|nr:Rust resistance kinase Lr10 [Glycine soja]
MEKMSKKEMEEKQNNGIAHTITPFSNTMGYVATETWSRHLGGVSHKSDVYNYGMMLLEMVGGRKNINAEASHTNEIYFPNWAYNKLELDNCLRPDMVMTTEENEIAKRLAIVGLWCTQTFLNDRPTMSRVIDMLEGIKET